MIPNCTSALVQYTSTPCLPNTGADLRLLVMAGILLIVAGLAMKRL